MQHNLGRNYFLLQPEDILLTKSGITSLPPKPSEIYTSDKINSLLDSNDSLHSQTIEMMKNNSAKNDYETLFVDAFKEMIDKIDSIDEIYSEKLNGTNFHMLHPDLQIILINTVLHYFSLRVNKYTTIVHERNPVFYIPQGIKLRNDEVVVQPYAAFLYHRIRELPAKNDQFDLQYMFYLNDGDKIWTRDNLLITLLTNELNRSDLLFNPDSCI